jgi:hypothetical protein
MQPWPEKFLTQYELALEHRADVLGCRLLTPQQTLTFALRGICGLRIPLRFAHARDGDPLEYASFCERVASRKGFSLRTRLQVDDE